MINDASPQRSRLTAPADGRGGVGEFNNPALFGEFRTGHVLLSALSPAPPPNGRISCTSDTLS